MFVLNSLREIALLIQSNAYHGYDGFAIFARDMDLAINNPSWKLIGTPWKKEEPAATTQAAKAKAAA
ncbi:MAG: hypothetical protein SWZ49_07960 [Cyanobacteriota bacterium]|nr:hypothetical protein [Cyanobacteriota bacterium]